MSNLEMVYRYDTFFNRLVRWYVTEMAMADDGVAADEWLLGEADETEATPLGGVAIALKTNKIRRENERLYGEVDALKSKVETLEDELRSAMDLAETWRRQLNQADKENGEIKARLRELADFTVPPEDGKAAS